MATQFMLTKNRLKRLMKHINAHGNDNFKGLLISTEGSNPTIKAVYEPKKTATPTAAVSTLSATGIDPSNGNGTEDICPVPPGCGTDIEDPDKSL